VHPLVFEPGEGWTYGGGIDWAGKLVERLNGGQRLGEYMKTHIWDPLGMKDTTFDITSRPDMMERMVSMSARLEDGTIVPIPLPYVSPPDDDLGGVGCYSTANDYVKLLTSLLKRDGKVPLSDILSLHSIPSFLLSIPRSPQCSTLTVSTPTHSC
jgi:CubicO group peptidase (beta-lactamase class C family)